MLRSSRTVIGCRLQTYDGWAGTVQDFYFDDISWNVRYLAARKRSIFGGTRVLAPPSSLAAPIGEARLLPVKLTLHELRSSLPEFMSRPASLSRSTMWGMGIVGSLAGEPVMGGVPQTLPWMLPSDGHETKTGDGTQEQCLASFSRSLGCTVVAIDGPMGSICDFIVETATWRLVSTVVGIGRMFKRRRVLIPAIAIKGLDIPERALYVRLRKFDIDRAQPFDGSLTAHEGNMPLCDEHVHRPTSRV